MKRSPFALSALAIALVAVAACASPPPAPEVSWHKVGASDDDREVARAECVTLASATTAPDKRYLHIAQGAAFMRCMRERGWEQVAEGS
jgi:hypothetical protein